MYDPYIIIKCENSSDFNIVEYIKKNFMFNDIQISFTGNTIDVCIRIPENLVNDNVRLIKELRNNDKIISINMLDETCFVTKPYESFSLYQKN